MSRRISTIKGFRGRENTSGLILCLANRSAKIGAKVIRYLYLVPVEAGCEISKDRFVMISYPCADVLGHGDKWVVETDVLLCRPVRLQASQDRLVEV
jgi:hypothetical protein